MLTIRDLSKTYDNGVRALRGVDLTISRGLFGLLGPNGAGKSTLMRTVATLQDADTGTIRLGELDVRREHHAVRRLLGYLPQDFGLYPRIDAETFLRHLAGLKGIRGARAQAEAAEALLRLTNLWSVRRRKLGTFSGGMRQRFGIAQALLADPQLVIVDEPTTGLDPEERRRFLNLLATLGERAVVILSTHLVADVRELCGDMAIIEAGQVRAQGTPDALVAKLEGRVWTSVLDRDTQPESVIEAAGGDATVLSTHLKAGRTVARVESDECPGTRFTATTPTLEDVYFSVLRRPVAVAA